MDNLLVYFPIYTLDDRILVQAGSLLTPALLDNLIASAGKPRPATDFLLHHGSITSDLLRLMGKPPYEAIFSDDETIAWIMKAFETIRLPLPILRSLDYFKKYDYHTYCHSLMVFALSTLIAKDLIPDYRDWLHEVAVGPTHDIGKLCVPLQIIQKQAPLTKSEKRVLEHHSVAGHVLLSYFQGDRDCLASVIARDHHERRDGSGRPRGVGLSDPLVEIVVACDVYDALISPRPYRPISYDNRTALEEITKMAEANRIGWDVVRALVAHNRRGKPHCTEATVSTDKRGAPPPFNFYGLEAEEPSHGI